jgi:hypothetical protein
VLFYLKNTKAYTDTWDGQSIDAGEYILVVSSTVAARFKDDDKTISDIGSGDLVVALSNDGLQDISSSAEAIQILNDSTPTAIADPFPANVSNYSFRGHGGSASLVIGTTNVDHLVHVTETRLINGAEVWGSNLAYGDKLSFQICDVDNLLGYGAGTTVIEEFGTDWQIAPGSIVKAFPGYVAAVPAGLYIRMKVTASVAGNFYYNLHLHK